MGHTGTGPHGSSNDPNRYDGYHPEFRRGASQALSEARAEIESLKLQLQSAMEERDAARASAISWESTARSLSDATLPCGHPEACAIDISQEGKPAFSSVGCVWCQRDAANSRMEEAEKKIRATEARHNETTNAWFEDSNKRNAELLALQSHVQKLRNALHRYCGGSSIKVGPEVADAALSTQPDLGLVEEVVNGLTQMKELRPFPAGNTDVYDWMDQCGKLIDRLLSRLSTSR